MTNSDNLYMKKHIMLVLSLYIGFQYMLDQTLSYC